MESVNQETSIERHMSQTNSRHRDCDTLTAACSRLAFAFTASIYRVHAPWRTVTGEMSTFWWTSWFTSKEKKKTKRSENYLKWKRNLARRTTDRPDRRIWPHDSRDADYGDLEIVNVYWWKEVTTLPWAVRDTGLYFVWHIHSIRGQESPTIDEVWSVF